MGQFADAMHDGWITGTGNVEYHADTAGWRSRNCSPTRSPASRWKLRDGSLPHLTLAGEISPLRIKPICGTICFCGTGSSISSKANFRLPVGIYQLSGTASLSRVLDIKLARDGARGFNITGTLSQPHVVHDTIPRLRPRSSHEGRLAFFFSLVLLALTPFSPPSWSQTSAANPGQVASVERKLQHLQSNGAQPLRIRPPPNSPSRKSTLTLRPERRAARRSAVCGLPGTARNRRRNFTG